MLQYTHDFYHPLEVYPDLSEITLPEEIFPVEKLVEWLNAFGELLIPPVFVKRLPPER